MLVKLAESFVVEVASGAADLARHRRSQVLETRDLQLYLGSPPHH
jgi:histone H3/H4